MTPEPSPCIARLGSPFRERPRTPLSTKAEPYPRRAGSKPSTSSSSSLNDGLYAHERPRANSEAERKSRRRPLWTMKGRVLDYGENNQATVPRRRPLAELDLGSPFVPRSRPVSPRCGSAYASSPPPANRPFTPPASSAAGSSDATELLTPHVPARVARAARASGAKVADDLESMGRLSDGDLGLLERLSGSSRGSTPGYPSRAGSSWCPSRYPGSLPSTPPRQIRGLLPGHPRISRIRRRSTAGPGRGSERGGAADRTGAGATGDESDESEGVNYSCCSAD